MTKRTKLLTSADLSHSAPPASAMLGGAPRLDADVSCSIQRPVPWRCPAAELELIYSGDTPRSVIP